MRTLGSAAVRFQETIHLRGTSLAGLLGCLPPPSKYNWVSDNRSFNITLLQYRRIVRGPGRDIEWEPRVPPFRLGRASELIRQINERWADVGAHPPSVPVCHLLVPWIPAQSDSSQLFSGHHLSASVTRTGTVWTRLLWSHWKKSYPFYLETAPIYIFFSYFTSKNTLTRLCCCMVLFKPRQFNRWNC